MNTQRLFIGGANRGGKSFTDSALKLLPVSGSYNGVVVVDPKEDRALRLAEYWRNNGVISEGIEASCEDVIEKVDADTVMLTIDTVSPISKILTANRKPTQWQLLARGLGHDGPVIGLTGSIPKGNSESRASSVRLIDTLSSFVPPQSSENIRKNLLNADRLAVMRKTVSEHSVRKLSVLGRDDNGGSLNLFWGTKNYPLIINEKADRELWSETKQEALETELPASLRNNREFAVASVGKKNVDFFVVESNGSKRMVRFHMPLMHALPGNVERTGSQADLAAAFGGMNLVALAIGTIVQAAVTD